MPGAGASSPGASPRIKLHHFKFNINNTVRRGGCSKRTRWCRSRVYNYHPGRVYSRHRLCFRTNGNIGISVLDRGVFVCPNLRGGSDLFGTKCAGLAGADSIGSKNRVSERTPTIAGLNVFVWRQEGEMLQPQLPDRLPQRDWIFFRIHVRSSYSNLQIFPPYSNLRTLAAVRRFRPPWS